MYSVDETKHIQLKVLLSPWVICIFTPYSHHRHRKILPRVPDYPFRVDWWVKFLGKHLLITEQPLGDKINSEDPTFLELSPWGENTSLQACRDINTNKLIVGSVSPTCKILPCHQYSQMCVFSIISPLGKFYILFWWFFFSELSFDLLMCFYETS